MEDRYYNIDGADRFFIDVMKVCEPPGYMTAELVDMSATQQIIADARRSVAGITYTHVITRAVALAFARHPELNRIVLRDKLVYPGTIDISLSVSTGLSVSAEPTVVLQRADTLDLIETFRTVTRKAQAARTQATAVLDQTRRLVRVVPTSALRRLLIRRMKARLSTVREKLGVFHISSGPRVEFGVPFVYPGIGVLGICRVMDRVVARDGAPVVRPTAWLTLAGDHRVWKATEVANFMGEVRQVLERGELAAEVPVDGSGADRKVTFVGSRQS